MSKLSNSVFGGAAFAVALTAATTANAAGPENWEISRDLSCNHGVERHVWDAERKKLWDGDISVKPRGGEAAFIEPGKINGETFKGDTALVIPGNGSVKMYAGKRNDFEGVSVMLPHGPSDGGYLRTFWSDVSAGNTIVANNWGEQPVSNISGNVGEISGSVNSHMAFEPREGASTGLSRVEYWHCKDAPQGNDDNDNNRGPGHQGGVSDAPAPGGNSTGL